MATALAGVISTFVPNTIHPGRQKAGLAKSRLQFEEPQVQHSRHQETSDDKRNIHSKPYRRSLQLLRRPLDRIPDHGRPARNVRGPDVWIVDHIAQHAIFPRTLLGIPVATVPWCG
jgi:hypothetical protein